MLNAGEYSRKASLIVLDFFQDRVLLIWRWNFSCRPPRWRSSFRLSRWTCWTSWCGFDTLSGGSTNLGFGLLVLLWETHRKTDDEGGSDEDHCATYFQVLRLEDHRGCYMDQSVSARPRLFVRWSKVVGVCKYFIEEWRILFIYAAVIFHTELVRLDEEFSTDRTTIRTTEAPHIVPFSYSVQ